MADINLSDITGVPVTTYQDLSAPAAGDMFWSMATSRNGCYIANGADYAIADEPDLYAAIGTAFNTQINPTTGSAWAAPAAGRFRVPDMRAVVPRGAGAISTGGSLAVGEYQGDTVQPHSHNLYAHGGDSSSGLTTVVELKAQPSAVFDPWMVSASSGADHPGAIGTETRVKARGGNWFIRRFNATYVAIGTGVATADRAGLISAMSGLIAMQSRATISFGVTSPTTSADSCAYFYQLPSGHWMMWFSLVFSWASQSPSSVSVSLTGVPMLSSLQSFSGMFAGAAVPTEAYTDVNGLYLSSNGSACTGMTLQGTIRLAGKPTI